VTDCLVPSGFEIATVGVGVGVPLRPNVNGSRLCQGTADDDRVALGASCVE